MGDKSKIEWTEASWNPIVGCSRVSDGCTNCYAIRQAHRIQSMGTTDAYDGTTRRTKKGAIDWTGVVKCLPERLDGPLRWKHPRRIFVNSMSDLFHPAVPSVFIKRVFAVMALAKQHTFQILTKRPERMALFLVELAAHDDPVGHLHYVADGHGLLDVGFANDRTWPLPNVWLGTSVENQEAADERIPHLLRCPAAVRWLSCEPLLGPVDLDLVCQDCDALILIHREVGDHLTEVGEGVQWVVVGGESGPGARPMLERWARSLIFQCRQAGIPVFMKQGSSANWPAPKDFDSFPVDLQVRQYPAMMETTP